MNLRAVAAQVIAQVLTGHSLNEALTSVINKFADYRDQSLLQAICFGVCRHYYQLTTILKLLLTKSLKEKDHDIESLLLVGLYQLLAMRIPEHAAVTETVKAVKDFKKIWAKNLVNAVLRKFIRQRAELEKQANQSLTALYNHPEWIIQTLQNNWPAEWIAILTANNQHPPFSLRVNQQHYAREKYLAQLSTNHAASIIPETSSGITLTVPIDVKQLPGFAVGDISVQDGAAQLAAELLELTPGLHVLDACAAPGGKTAHMLEIQPKLEMLAIDVDAERLTRVSENLQRLKLTATCVAADVQNLASWWDGRLFDRILLDAPCSASGVIRRHPDIKLLRRSTDIAALAATQLQLLAKLWTTLAPGGLLLYATCSIFSEENVNVLQAFLSQYPEAKEEKIKSTWGKECVVGRQIFPGMHGMDGFYFARLRK